MTLTSEHFDNPQFADFLEALFLNEVDNNGIDKGSLSSSLSPLDYYDYLVSDFNWDDDSLASGYADYTGNSLDTDEIDVNGDGDVDATIIDTNDNGEPDTAIVEGDTTSEQDDAVERAKDELDVDDDKLTSTGSTESELDEDNDTLSDKRSKTMLYDSDRDKGISGVLKKLSPARNPDKKGTISDFRQKNILTALTRCRF